MSKLLARIMLAVFMLPSAAVVYIMAIAFTEKARRYSPSYGYYPRRIEWLVAGVSSWMFILAWWILLWRRSIVWTRSRKRATLWSFGASAIIGCGTGILCDWVDREFAYFVFTAVTILVWLSWTVFIWRESTGERKARLDHTNRAIVCPTCGYNLTGLNQARCPECGSTFTLDDLLAQQPQRAGTEIEAAD